MVDSCCCKRCGVRLPAEYPPGEERVCEGKSKRAVFVAAAALVLVATSCKEPPARPAAPKRVARGERPPAPPKRAEPEPKSEEREMEAQDRNLARVERWGVFEVSLEGPEGGNPFLDVKLTARFTQGERAFEPEGFYDGGGTYRVRFMPDTLGVWRYVTRSNKAELDGKAGEFLCVEPSPGNHGPVRVHNTWHFAYADGTPYFQVGTTCYCWTH